MKGKKLKERKDVLAIQGLGLTNDEGVQLHVREWLSENGKLSYFILSFTAS
jgi:hypothetical protein